MLADLRLALADVIRRGVPHAHVEAYPVESFVDSPDGLSIYLEGDADRYLDAWLTFSRTGRGTVVVWAVASCPGSMDAATAYATLDDVIDPLSDGPTIFAAVLGTDGQPLALDLPGSREATVAPFLASVGAPVRVRLVDGEANAIRYEARVPLELTVKRT